MFLWIIVGVASTVVSSLVLPVVVLMVVGLGGSQVQSVQQISDLFSRSATLPPDR